MSENEKILLYPDPQKIQEMAKEIDMYIRSKNLSVVDALSSLIIMIISIGQEFELSKAEILGYISNHWELNDPENEHPNRENCLKIIF